MTSALRVVKLALMDLWDDILLLVVFNLIWCVSAVLIVPIPFASMGLATAAAAVGEGKVIKWRTFFEGGRRLLKPAYTWGVMSLMVWSLLLLNIFFYHTMAASWSIIPEMVFAMAALAFFLIQLYVPPFLIVQEAPSLREAYRNSLILFIMRPSLTIVVLVTSAVVVGLSYLLIFPIFVFLVAFLMLLGNRAVVETIKAEKNKEGGESLLAQ
jgi:uncharacterized membrane protein YesL